MNVIEYETEKCCQFRSVVTLRAAQPAAVMPIGPHVEQQLSDTQCVMQKLSDRSTVLLRFSKYQAKCALFGRVMGKTQYHTVLRHSRASTHMQQAHICSCTRSTAASMLGNYCFCWPLAGLWHSQSLCAKADCSFYTPCNCPQVTYPKQPRHAFTEAALSNTTSPHWLHTTAAHECHMHSARGCCIQQWQPQKACNSSYGLAECAHV